MKSIRQIIPCLSIMMGVLFLASCSKETTVTQKKVRSGLDKYNNGYDLEKGEHGMMQSKSTKKSYYNTQRTTPTGGKIAKSSYGKESFKKKSWGQNSQYSSKEYNGNKSYKSAPYYASQNTSFDKGYSTAGSTYQGQNFSQGNARPLESRSNDVATSTSGYVNSRENVPSPTIISRDDYNQLGVQDSNRLLGR